MCWYCQNPITIPEPIGRSERCICGKDLRCCKNCRFFLPGSRGDCNEAGAEFQADKERANFCDWFSLNPKYRNKNDTGNSEDPAKTAKSVFDNLFKP